MAHSSVVTIGTRAHPGGERLPDTEASWFLSSTPSPGHTFTSLLQDCGCCLRCPLSACSVPVKCPQGDCCGQKDKRPNERLPAENTSHWVRVSEGRVYMLGFLIAYRGKKVERGRKREGEKEAEEGEEKIPSFCLSSPRLCFLPPLASLSSLSLPLLPSPLPFPPSFFSPLLSSALLPSFL